MMTRILFSMGLLSFLGAGLVSNIQDSGQRPLSAPTYYLVARVKDCNSAMVEVLGATNLPTYSQVTVQIADFESSGWKYFSDEVATGVDAKGYFAVSVSSRKGFSFHQNMLAVVSFMPYRPSQPPEVLKVVGKKGQFLGPYGDWTNPQLGMVSGENYVLTTLARVPECTAFPHPIN